MSYLNYKREHAEFGGSRFLPTIRMVIDCLHIKLMCYAGRSFSIRVVIRCLPRTKVIFSIGGDDGNVQTYCY